MIVNEEDYGSELENALNKLENGKYADLPACYKHRFVGQAISLICGCSYTMGIRIALDQGYSLTSKQNTRLRDWGVKLNKLERSKKDHEDEQFLEKWLKKAIKKYRVRHDWFTAAFVIAASVVIFAIPAVIWDSLGYAAAGFFRSLVLGVQLFVHNFVTIEAVPRFIVTVIVDSLIISHHIREEKKLRW